MHKLTIRIEIDVQIDDQTGKRNRWTYQISDRKERMRDRLTIRQEREIDL